MDNQLMAKKWIQVYLSIYLDKGIPEQKIQKSADDVAMILNNTHSQFTVDNQFLGCINPYLNINAIFTDRWQGPSNIVMYEAKSFACQYGFSEERDAWHIILYPVKEDNSSPDMYSIERLHHDMYILGHASDYITQRYGITVHTMEGSCKPELVDGHPILTHYVRLIVLRYNVFDRLSYRADQQQKQNPLLDEMVLSSNFAGLLQEIFSKEPDSEWTTLVKSRI